jgi:hypothetical protein
MIRVYPGIENRAAVQGRWQGRPPGNEAFHQKIRGKGNENGPQRSNPRILTHRRGGWASEMLLELDQENQNVAVMRNLLASRARKILAGINEYNAAARRKRQ